jgi:ATP-binding cassette subfamily B protein
MTATAWETRTAETLVFRYQPDSYAAQHIDVIVAGYERAFSKVSAFFGQSRESLPQLNIYLCEFLPAEDGKASGGETRHNPETGEIWLTVNSESPGVEPALDLTQLFLQRLFGVVTPDKCFWYDGLAGYLAGKCDPDSHSAGAPARIQKLFEAGQLPPLVDLLALYGIRQSAAGVSIATAFVGFLVGRNGAERYKRLLAALEDGRYSRAFQRVYGSPLQTLEQAWYRELEAAAVESAAGMSDAVNQLIPYMKMYKGRLLAILGCILAAISFAIFMPMAIRLLVNNILARGPLPFSLPGLANAGERLNAGDQQIEALLWLLGAMIFMFALSAFANAFRSRLLGAMGEAVNFDLRMRYFHHLQRLPVGFHRRTPNQDITQRFWSDVTMISQALTLGIVPMAQSFLGMLIFGIVLLAINWQLALISLVGLPLFAFNFQRMRAKMRDATRERARRVADVSQSLVETLNAQERVRLYGLRDYLGQRIVDRLDLLRNLVVKITEMSSASVSTSLLITNGAQVIVLVYGGLIVINSQGAELRTGDLMAFYILLLQFYAPAGLFTGSMGYVSQATTSIDRVNGVLKEKAEAEDAEAVKAGPLKEAIRFESVSYGRSSGGKDLISDLSLEIKAGTKVAFVGPPGAGKASIIDLLPRLFEVDAGAITWDGVDIRKIEGESLRRQIAVVSQETYVFRATIYDNVRYGRVEANDDEVIQAAKLAGLHEFILGLPGGYDSQVTDRDSTFGLVQRQRLAVARALLQDAPVVLMDDALTALDTAGQAGLENALRGPDRNKTLIRVAQRIGSVLDADQIFVLDGGKLIEQGRHEDLADAGGLYAQLLKDELGAGAVSGAFQAVRRLARQAPFSALPPEILEEVARLMLYAERSPGDIICRQGTVGDELFVLGRGEVEVVLEDEDGQERILGLIGEGEYFGEISFLRRVPRTATVRARTNVELHILRRQDFDQLLERLGTDIAAHLDQTAQARIEATRAALAATEAAPA